jgi:hypothetical protein
VVKDKIFAKEVVELLLEYSGRLDESVARAKRACPEAEFLAYREAIGDVMGETWDRLLMPSSRFIPSSSPRTCSDHAPCAI